MEPLLARNWPLVALRGVFAMAFGLLAWSWSNEDAATIARVVGVLAAALGALSLAASLGARRAAERPWSLGVEGAASCVIAAVLLGASHDSATVARIVAAWVAIVGLLEGATARDVRGHARTPKLLVAFMLVSLGASLSLLALASAEPIVHVWLLGAWACLFSASTLWLARAVRSDAAHEHVVVRAARWSSISIA